ncbi:MAG: HAD-IA family hydrolase [Rhizobiaceae bacterium]|nr:HAD-IA family hydrolase [Rhizobiaceae bacterium]
MKLALFDCDGTLVDSGRLIHEVMIRTFEHHGHERPHYDATKSIIGLTLDTAIARIMGVEVDDHIRAMMQHYKDIYGPVRQEPGFQEPLYDGIDEMMAALVAREDVLIGAVTGKARKGLDLIRTAHGFEDIFFVSRTADDCPSKPHPAMVLECCADAGIDPADTIVIGDSVYDMMMAKSAGAQALGVSWGYGEADALSAAGADAVVHEVAHILHHI